MHQLRKNATNSLLLLGTIAALGGCSTAGRVPPPYPEVTAIVAGMPADNTEEEDAITASLVRMGPGALMQVCGMLLPPGEGDDAGARYALSGLSRYVHRPAAENERAMYSRVLMAALELIEETEVKAFLIRQLQLVGRDEAVTTLGGYLADERLCEPAAQALVAIGTSGAEIALLNALPSAGGKNTVTIIKALGDLESKAAFFEVWRYAASSDPSLRDAALYALANIGPVSTGDLLADASVTGSSYEKATNTSYLLLYAKRLAEAGRKEEGAAICRDLMSSRTSPGEENILIAALSTLLEIMGGEALIDVYLAVRSPNIEIRSPALILAEEMPGEDATLMWFNMQQRAQSGLKADLRSMLRARSEHFPTPVLEEAIVEWDEEEQRAAWASMDSLALVAEGFRCLFNGSDLTGWVGDKIGYVVEEGKIVVDPERRGGGGNLYTEEEYDNFIFRFQFRLTPGANNGLGIRAPQEGDAAYAGMELQILDNVAERYADLQPYQYHGSIYGVVPALRGFQRTVGEWNTQEVIADGRQITVILNGKVIVDADIDEASTPETMDGRDHPGLKRDKGHIGFLGHGSRVEFRNIWIKPLPE